MKSIAERLRDRPPLDHSMLSPNGRVPKRAKAAAMERHFGGENRITAHELHLARLAAIQPSAIERLEREAARCRDHAACGLRPRANAKRAAEIEAQIKEMQR